MQIGISNHACNVQQLVAYGLKILGSLEEHRQGISPIGIPIGHTGYNSYRNSYRFKCARIAYSFYVYL